MSKQHRHDAVIVGGGHNGLVAAFYLAQRGLRPLVLERRPFVGGACNTEEFAPGFRASTGAYVLSMLREQIWRDMRLAKRGLVVDPAGPSLNLFADGTAFMLDDDIRTTQKEIGRFSRSDAEAFPAFEAELAAWHRRSGRCSTGRRRTRARAPARRRRSRSPRRQGLRYRP